jgi:hypothetical protein
MDLNLTKVSLNEISNRYKKLGSMGSDFDQILDRIGQQIKISTAREALRITHLKRNRPLGQKGRFVALNIPKYQNVEI